MTRTSCATQRQALFGPTFSHASFSKSNNPGQKRSLLDIDRKRCVRIEKKQIKQSAAKPLLAYTLFINIGRCGSDTHTHTYARTHARTHARAHSHARAHTRTRTHAHARAHTHTHTHARTRARAHARAHTHINITAHLGAQL